MQVREGLTNREIGARLFIAPSTVKSRLDKIYEKLGVRTRAAEAAGQADGAS
jgi:DNA-binding NarL/FixJ family response regulator